MAKKDPHKHEQKYLNWKERIKDGIPEVSKANSDLIKRFLNDMELGLNVSVSSKNGARSFIRLNTIRDKMTFFARKTESLFKLNCITELTEEQIHNLFADMRSGKIKRENGQDYKSVGYFVKNFKSFWHWYMLVMKKEGDGNYSSFTHTDLIKQKRHTDEKEKALSDLFKQQTKDVLS